MPTLVGVMPELNFHAAVNTAPLMMKHAKGELKARPSHPPIAKRRMRPSLHGEASDEAPAEWAKPANDAGKATPNGQLASLDCYPSLRTSYFTLKGPEGMILYLHGFTSGPQSHKAQALGQRMRERGLGDFLVCPQLPASPREAIALTTDLIARRGITTVVGSSLGCYYATWLAETFDLKAVLVNPAVVARLSLQDFVGPQRWLYSANPSSSPASTSRNCSPLRCIF